jgi:predicted AAA+ superfamily ATPase
VETLVQGVIRDANLQVHFYREVEDPDDRRSRQHEVDFVAERVDGSVLPIEAKFRKRIDAPDLDGLRYFMRKFASPSGVVVTRDLSRWDADERILYIPLQSFLLAF